MSRQTVSTVLDIIKITITVISTFIATILFLVNCFIHPLAVRIDKISEQIVELDKRLYTLELRHSTQNPEFERNNPDTNLNSNIHRFYENNGTMAEIFKGNRFYLLIQ